MAKIAIDCDGVLADFQSAFNQMTNKIWPGRVKIEYRWPGYNDFGGLTREEREQVWAKIIATENWWMTLNALSTNVADLMTFLQCTRGHDVYIVTARRPVAGATVAFQTDVWLRACGVQPHSNYIGVLAVEQSWNKHDVYKAAQIEFSVDDSGETIEQCDTLVLHRAFLLDQPWNKDADVRNRISDMKPFFRAVDSRFPKVV